VAALGGLVLLGWLVSGVVLWWDKAAITAVQARKVQLEGEVAKMQATRDDWARSGMLARVERCNPGDRPCIRVNEEAGAFGEHSDYRVLRDTSEAGRCCYDPKRSFR